MRITIPGAPIALKRHRHHAGGTFDPQKKEKRSYAEYAICDFREPAFQEALVVEIDYVYLPPQSWSKKKQQASLGAVKTSAPDLSNLIKFTEDALNGVVWEDDRIIVELRARKLYGNEECTIINIEKANDKAGEENESDV